MKILMIAVSLLAATPVLADTAEVPRAGATLVDNSGKRIGRIDRILADGSLRLIAGDKFVTVPASTVSMKDGAVATSLSRKEVTRL